MAWPNVHTRPSTRYILSKRRDLAEKSDAVLEKKVARNREAKEAAGAVLSGALIIEVSKWRDSDVLPYKWHHISGQVSPVCRVALAWCMDDGILAGLPTHCVTPIGSRTLTLSSFLSYIRCPTFTPSLNLTIFLLVFDVLHDQSPLERFSRSLTRTEYLGI